MSSLTSWIKEHECQGNGLFFWWKGKFTFCLVTNSIAIMHTVFPHIVSAETSFLNLEIVENSNSCLKFLFLTISYLFSIPKIVLIWNFIVLLNCCTWENWKKYFSRLEKKLLTEYMSTEYFFNSSCLFVWKNGKNHFSN